MPNKRCLPVKEAVPGGPALNFTLEWPGSCYILVKMLDYQQKMPKNRSFSGRPVKCSKKTKILLTGAPLFEILTTHTATTRHIHTKMRTKKLLLLAAVTAAGLTASQAQTVYSLNTVGYVNWFMTNGYNMVCNPLDLDGTGTNNTLTTVFSTNLPNSTIVYAFTNGGWVSSTYSTSGGGKFGGSYTPACNYALQPGRGVLVKWPAGALATNFTFIGTVMQGTLSNTLPAAGGYVVVSSQVPQGGHIQTDLGLTPVKNDAIDVWNPTNQAYNAAVTYNGSKWGGAGEPVLNAGQAVMYKSNLGAQWVRTFTVQ
jgi:hypothetical protein